MCTMDASTLGQLIAITVPVAAVAALHAWLALKGERGTLLLPQTGAFQETWCPTCVLGAIANATARARLAQRYAHGVSAANDGTFREVA
jgi:hypothetical protein